MKASVEIVTGTQNGTQLLLKGLGYHSKDTFRLAQKMTIKMTTLLNSHSGMRRIY